MSHVLIDTGLHTLTIHKPKTGHRILASGVRHHRLGGGAAYIAGEDSGIVTIAGKPAARRILLIDKATLRIVDDVWSNADGTYRLDGLDENRCFIVLALDDQTDYEPVAWDDVQPYKE